MIIIYVECDNCGHTFQVDHLDWTHIQCTKCEDVIPNDYQVVESKED